MSGELDTDEEGCLHTETGETVPRLKVTASLFIDKTIVVNGPSKTGKTVIIKHIMKTITGHIEQVLIVAPSEPSNRSYEGIVDPPLIHYRLFLADPANPKKDDGTKGALRFLETVWQRQEMMAAIYTRANNAEVLSQIFQRLPQSIRSEGFEFIKDINKKRKVVIDQLQKRYAADAGRQAEKMKEVNEKFKQMLVLLYKKYIAPSYHELWEVPELTENERYSLYYLNFNPRLLLIFDDCAAQLKPFFSKDIFRRLFYQNRHVFTTVIMACQDDTDLPANLRKNAFVSFYTTAIVAQANFERASNQYSKPTKAYVNAILSSVFRKHRKLAYIREDESQQHFYHIECPYPKPFRFGSTGIHELCEAVKSDGVSMDKDNPFYDRFKI